MSALPGCQPPEHKPHLRLLLLPLPQRAASKASCPHLSNLESKYNHMSNTLATVKEPTRDLKALLSSENVKAQFALALPKHLGVERFCRVAITALSRTPKLRGTTPESFMRCLLDLSAYGIEPDGRRAHLIPYGDQCTLILDWKGLAELALRSGMIAKLHADIVCERDIFEYDRGEVTRHVVNWREPRGEMYAAYAVAITKTGETFTQVMTRDEIDSIRKRSKAGNNGPWVTDYNEMAKKTVFRRLSKWLPLSPEFRDAVERDDDALPERDVTPPPALSFDDPTAAEPAALAESADDPKAAMGEERQW